MLNWTILRKGAKTMRKSKFTEEKIIQILKEGAAGAKIDELCRRYEISRATYYSWRSKYEGLEISELKRLKALEAENSKLKQLLAEAQLHNVALKDLVSKKW
jgi:putative transposase